jgi:hypothetical protein
MEQVCELLSFVRNLAVSQNMPVTLVSGLGQISALT